MLVQSQVNTGKTMAYIISALHLVDFRQQKCQILIVTATHVLAQQVRCPFILQMHGVYVALSLSARRLKK